MSQNLLSAGPTPARRPRRATRIAPFVVLVALVTYALVVFALFTAPARAKAMPAGAKAMGSVTVGRPGTIDVSDNSPWTTPTMPPKCTDSQVAAGTVAGCLVTKSFEPVARTWGSPPFPFTSGAPNPGWKWLGWTYNGSPALKDWESTLWKNAEKVGSIRAGTLQAPPAALALFEGFLAEVQANGYRITDVGAYNFRCTSNTRKDCNGLDASSLSNHAWGLAIDINSGANPELRYTPLDEGGSACSTPMTTNIPRWVVQTAEKWGLLWGGYGWSGGCGSPSAMKTSVLRDPTHFEFRGTQDEAIAIAAANGRPVRRYCANVVEGTTTVRRCAWADKPQAGWRTAVSLQAPTGATAALVNITLTGAEAVGYVTAEACDVAISGERSSSNGNVSPGLTVANLAVVPVDQLGRFCLYNSVPMQTIVDVQGFFLPSKVAGPFGSLFTPLSPTRVLDTRNGPRCDTSGACTATGRVNQLEENGVVVGHAPAGSLALLANITVTDTAAGGYATADSCESLAPGEQTRSNINFAGKDTVANLAVVPVGQLGGRPGFCAVSSAATHAIVDVQGVFAPAPVGQWGYTPMTPTRLVDTRKSGTRATAGGVTRVTAPAGASAVLVNLTVLDGNAIGYATADRCSTLVPGPQSQSNANMVPGRTTANLAVVPVDPDGTFCVYTSAATELIVDVQGTFSPGGDLRFVAINSTRRLDSRIPS